MSVAVDVNGTSTWVTPHPARIRPAAIKLDALPALAAALPASTASPPADRDVQAWAWVVDEAAADRVLDNRRAAFVVMFKDVPGVSPDDLAPAIVRLTAVASGGRLVAAARGSADLASRTAAEWDLSKDLKQDAVRSESQLLERGAVRIRPAADLPPGQYAVVLRPSSKKKVSSAAVLSSSGEGRPLALAWDFEIK
jgi:hypothetical protein